MTKLFEIITMKTKIFLIIAVALIGWGAASAASDAEALLKEAKKEAKYLHPSQRIKKRQKSDPQKYVTMTRGDGTEYVDRGLMALDLFQQAAEAGSGEAAYILFAYNALGMYDGKQYFSMIPSTYEGPEAKLHHKNNFDTGLDFLEKAARLHYPEAVEIQQFVSDNPDIEADALWYKLSTIYDAQNGDAFRKSQCAGMYKNLGMNDKFEYWMEKSLREKDWRLNDRVYYANYLLDKGLRDKAIETLKPAEKKKDYKDDMTASGAISSWVLFYLADCLYGGNAQRAYDNCDNLFRDEKWKNADFQKYYKKHDGDYLEYCVDRYAEPSRIKLHEAAYALNPNTTDSLLLYYRGTRYELQGDTLKAFDYFKSSALKGHIPAIIRTLNLAASGKELTQDELSGFLPIIIKTDNGDGSFVVRGDFANWKTYYVLGEFFYNSDFRDYKKAVAFFDACAKDSSCPAPLRGESARYLFKCYTNGRGVEADQDMADKWLAIARKYGDHDADAIHKALFPQTTP